MNTDKLKNLIVTDYEFAAVITSVCWSSHPLSKGLHFSSFQLQSQVVLVKC